MHASYRNVVIVQYFQPLTIEFCVTKSVRSISHPGGGAKDPRNCIPPCLLGKFLHPSILLKEKLPRDKCRSFLLRPAFVCLSSNTQYVFVDYKTHFDSREISLCEIRIKDGQAVFQFFVWLVLWLAASQRKAQC